MLWAEKRRKELDTGDLRNYSDELIQKTSTTDADTKEDRHPRNNLDYHLHHWNSQAVLGLG